MKGINSFHNDSPTQEEFQKNLNFILDSGLKQTKAKKLVNVIRRHKKDILNICSRIGTFKNDSMSKTELKASKKPGQRILSVYLRFKCDATAAHYHRFKFYSDYFDMPDEFITTPYMAVFFLLD